MSRHTRKKNSSLYIRYNCHTLKLHLVRTWRLKMLYRKDGLFHLLNSQLVSQYRHPYFIWIVNFVVLSNTCRVNRKLLKDCDQKLQMNFVKNQGFVQREAVEILKSDCVLEMISDSHHWEAHQSQFWGGGDRSSMVGRRSGISTSWNSIIWTFIFIRSSLSMSSWAIKSI